MGILRDKSYSFAVEVVKLCRKLTEGKKEYVISRQLLRSGTSIGAQTRESVYAQSKADFVNKLSIALKEANETMYWLDLLRDTNYIDEQEYENLSACCQELLKLLTSSIKTAKEIR